MRKSCRYLWIVWWLPVSGDLFAAISRQFEPLLALARSSSSLEIHLYLSMLICSSLILNKLSSGSYLSMSSTWYLHQTFLHLILDDSKILWFRSQKEVVNSSLRYSDLLTAAVKLFLWKCCQLIWPMQVKIRIKIRIRIDQKVTKMLIFTNITLSNKETKMP